MSHDLVANAREFGAPNAQGSFTKTEEESRDSLSSQDEGEEESWRIFDDVDMDYTDIAKIVLVGDSGVGKTCILQRFAGEKFQENHLTTIGVDFKTRTAPIGVDRKIKLVFWDTCGQERFRSIAGGFFRGASIIVFVYDVTNADSFLNVDKWLHDYKISSNLGKDADVTKFMLGNKCESFRKIVDFDTASRFADERDFVFLEVSAKDNTNVDQAFNLMVEKLMERNDTAIEAKIPQQEETITNLDKSKKNSFNCCSIS